MRRIICENTGAEFIGSESEAIAAGWRKSPIGWTAPSHGWDRHPAAIPSHFVAYDNGIDFAPVPLNFN